MIEFLKYIIRRDPFMGGFLVITCHKICPLVGRFLNDNMS